jgi:hypothetical protein
MQTKYLSNLIALLIFMILNGAVAYYLWMAFKKNLAKKKTPLSMFNVAVVFLPMLAFSYGFFFLFR